MKKLLLLSLIFSCITVHAMEEKKQHTKKRTPSTQKKSIPAEEKTVKIKNAISEVLTDVVEQSIATKVRSLALQERIKRLPGYENFDLLSQLEEKKDSVSFDKALQFNGHQIKIDDEYVEITDENQMEILDHAQHEARDITLLQAAIEEMEELLKSETERMDDHREKLENYKELEQEVELMKTASESSWCAIL